MRIIRGLKNLKRPINNSILAIGVFDGVHLGHKAVIEKVVNRTRSLNAKNERLSASRGRFKSVIVTFHPHPMKVLRPNYDVPSLISMDHRMRLAEDMGADIFVILHFTKTFSRLRSENFIKRILIDKLGTKEIFIGDNFYFGKGASSSAATLISSGKHLGFAVSVVKPVKVKARTISSSRIRALIKHGALGEASRLLGRPVSVLGTVVSGAGIARDLGYPTANINPHHEVIPPSGVYAVRVNINNKMHKGVLNIGARPTFYGPRDMEPAIEVNIFDFDGKIYGKDLEILFVKKIRDEVKFATRKALIDQIRKDAKSAKSMLSR